MSSSQTTAERELPWIPLLVGLIVGLALGLFIGWVLWPVEYAGASFMDMPQETRTNYVSAVADGYAIYRNPEAALEAGERLTVLGDHAPDEILAAIDYYRTPPNENAVRVVNLAQLATDLGIPVDATIMQLATPAQIATPPTYVAIGETPTAQAAVESAGEQASATDAAPSAGEQSSLLPWLAALAAIVLVIGGVVLLSRLGGKNRATEDAGGAPPSPESNPNSSPGAEAAGQNDAGVRRAGSARINPGEDDEFFDDGEGPAVQKGHSADDDLLMADDPSNLLDEDELDDEEEEDLSQAYIQRPNGGGAATPPTDRHTLGSFTARFQGTAATFSNDVRQIKDPTTGANLGEYGLEMNDRNRTLSSTPDQVVVLNVYLFDKAQPRSPVTTRRALLSELASDKGAEKVFTKEGSENLRPFVAQPGNDFTVDGNVLAIKGRIREARYDQDGAFQEMVVDMAVVRRGS